jgi:pseudaminic acid synthase
MKSFVTIGEKSIGKGYPVWIIAEISANHNRDFEQAARLVREAKRVGADAVKLQTYTPDTITIDCDNEYFRIGKGTIWEDKTLYELYKEAYTPWEWQPKLKDIANGLGMDLFSSPFDDTAVDFLEKMDVPAYKIASFELVDLPLIRRVARTGKPIIMSTGMATNAEIEEALRVAKEEGASQIALLKCTSAYPALPDEMHLRSIGRLEDTFQIPVGLSDHTLGIAIPVAAVALGACIVEKHFTLSRAIPGPDTAFSLEPLEFEAMVEAIRATERAMGDVNAETTQREKANRTFRRSLFIVQDMKSGDVFTKENLRSIRPGYGLHTRFLNDILGKVCSRDIKKGTPMREDMVLREN